MAGKDTDYGDICKAVRRDIFVMISNAGCGHFGGSLSCVEILAALYFKGMRIDPDNPNWEERDRFVNSKGHATAAYYATLANRGYFGREQLLESFISAGSCFEEHGCVDVPGVDISTGSLGQGLSIGAGMALAAKLKRKKFSCYVLLGDGECQEGQVWEAAMFGAYYGLDNLVSVIDRNGLQVMGRTEDLMSIEPIGEKWLSFGWDVFHTEGNDVEALLKCFRNFERNGKPKVVIAKTVKGKGISFMENNPDWHAFKDVTAEELKIAKKELGIG
jgi:transketolase